MGQCRFKAPVLGAVWRGALTLLILAQAGKAQVAYQADPVAPAGEALPPPDQPTGADDPADDVLNMDLDQLSRADVVVAPAMDLEVSTVSRQESTVGRSPAAVFVITPEMIRRSGARNVPDLLRMVPGVEVARISSNIWAITARGFNNRFAGKLLVQIDGRSVYHQISNGIHWDAQDVVLEDVERIEVIRGPGATVWGSNAVNGVINIITKRAEDTQGLLVSGGTGTEERGFSTARYGGRIGNDLHWRVYGKQFERDGGYFPTAEFDDWRQGRGGFRADWTPSCQDMITFQGDFYEGFSGASETDAFATAPFLRTLTYDSANRGQNGLLRWTRVIDDDTDWSIQTYFDRFNRSDTHIDLLLESLDVDTQVRFPVGRCHNLICGAGFRTTSDSIVGTFAATAVPSARTNQIFSGFIQDQITLEEDRWYLIAGSKFEHNDFSGFEYQPTVRLLHLPSDRESLWCAVSRAVRVPGRSDQNFLVHGLANPIAPSYVEIMGDPSAAAEELLATEFGYRAQPRDELSWDLALFWNHYENLITNISAGAPFFDAGIGATLIPIISTNALAADTYGAELATNYQFNANWQLTGAFTLFYADFDGPTGGKNNDTSPHNRIYLRSSWNIGCEWEFDLTGRYVDSIDGIGIQSYFVGDVRIAWCPRERFQWEVVGRNLFDGTHAEFTDSVAGTFHTDVQPEVFTNMTWTY